jgi:flagellar M-ring protein FliF
MAEEKKDQFSNIREFFRKIPFQQKLYLIFGAIFVLLVVLIIVNVVSAVNYSVLYSNLTQRDSGKIIEKLRDKKVPYKLSSGGNIIRVPDERVAELRIELASEGLPEGGGVGFEIFDKTSLASNNFTQRINYIRAKEGEIARSISSLEEITAAKVHITLPEDSVFVQDKKAAKASIIIKMKPGAYLSSSIVPAICHLTAQAVDGLEIRNIAVIDMHGKLLSKPVNSKEDDFETSSAFQLNYTRQVEQRFKDRILELLSPMAGSGQLSVNVDLTLDFNKQITKREIVDPDKTAKISEQIETSSSRGSSQGGVPGTGSNIAATQTQTQSAGNSNETKSEKTTTNFEVSKTITQSTKQLGRIEKVSVAVVIGNRIQSNIVNEELVRESSPRTPEEMAEITRLVKAAIGFEQTRGDIVEVVNTPFDNSRELEMNIAQKGQAKQDLIDKAIKYGSYFFAGIFLFFFIVRPFMKKSKSIIQSAMLPRATKSLAAVKVDKETAALKEAAEEKALQEEMENKFKVPKETKKKELLLAKIRDFARENTDETVSLIRTILTED